MISYYKYFTLLLGLSLLLIASLSTAQATAQDDVAEKSKKADTAADGAASDSDASAETKEDTPLSKSSDSENSDSEPSSETATTETAPSEDNAETETEDAIQDSEGDDGTENLPSEEEKTTQSSTTEDTLQSAPSVDSTVVSHQDVAVKNETAPVVDPKEDSKRHLFIVTYNMAKPSGATANFVDEFSFEGFGFEYRFLLKKKLSIGALFSWSTFEKKEVGNFSLDANTTIDGTRIKMVDLIQLAPSVHYYFTTQSAKAVPFVGMNIGPYYASHIIDWGWWYQKEATWQFGFTPEAGVRIAGLPVPFYLAVRYSYSFEANSLKAQQYVGFNLGIAFLK